MGSLAVRFQGFEADIALGSGIADDRVLQDVRDSATIGPASEVTSKVRARGTARLIIGRDPLLVGFAFEWSTELKDIIAGLCERQKVHLR